MNQGRRDFLIGLSKGAAAVGVVGYGGLGVASLFAGEPPAVPVGTRIDFHSHLFGEGHGGTGCFLSKQQKEHFNYRFFRALLDIDDKKGPPRRTVSDSHHRRPAREQHRQDRAARTRRSL